MMSRRFHYGRDLMGRYDLVGSSDRKTCMPYQDAGSYWSDYNSSHKCPAGAVAGVSVISRVVYRVDAICFNSRRDVWTCSETGCTLRSRGCSVTWVYSGVL